MKKILYILSHPIQYQSPLLKKIASQKEIDLKVFYLTDHTLGGVDKQFGKRIEWDIPILEGYNYEFIKNYSPKPAVSGSFLGLINLNIIKKINKENPDIVVIHGWGYFTNWLIFIFSFLLNTKIWLRAESPLNQEFKKKKIVLLIKKILLQYFIFKKIDKFLFIGTQNKEFYKYYGVPDNKLIFTPYAVNNEYFTSEYNKWKNRKDKIRKELKIPENNIVLLTVGKYIPKKRPFDIIEAFRQQKAENLSLIMLGEGNLRTKMEEKINKDNISNVILTGFVNQSEISKYYAAADIFILSSTVGETWGLVVNEAMNFGLPVICSDMPGSAYDLIENNKNGFIYKTGNITELIDHIAFIVNNKSFRNDARVLSLEKVKKYSYDVMIENIKKALKTQ
jgi:glycosyltransferase involved in cell wall biosynthesis